MSKNYKETLNMPKTDFPMRGNLGVKEVGIQEKWEELDLYNKRNEKNINNNKFMLHDGPPYANGNIHSGHALNKILKDFIVRFNSMTGNYSRYIPGWDTHGLPIETAITKTGVKRKELNIIDFRNKCKDYALEQVSMQSTQFQRLGVLGEFQNPYLTLNKDFEAEQIKVFGKMVAKGLIYKGLRPVYWSPSSETALAEAEIEYIEKRSPSVYVSFKDMKNDYEYVIWTTTPWTLPANMAIAVGENIVYNIVKVDKRKYVLASNRVEDFVKELEIENYEILKTINGSELEGNKYFNIVNKKELSVVIGHHVSDEGGTGLVHIAPGHGEDDFIVGKKYNLDVVCPVDEKGYMMKTAGFVEGLYYEDANKVIGEELQKNDALLKLKFIKHSYPHDWRTKKPIIFRATPQWFASIEKIKTKMMEEVSNVQWLPNWGEVRINNMIKDRESWCISRQRSWGLPIPIFYAEDGSEILSEELINHVSDLFKEHGSDIWFEKSAKELLPKGFTHELSPNGIFKKETDIMDVWFDSGTSHHSVLKNKGLDVVADLYLEGSDQYRGWFNSSLSTSVAITNKAPYKKVVTHGFVLDEKGKKMSKSLGNTIDPIKLVKKYGADVFRLWVASVDYQSDVRIGEGMMKQVSESYRKIRNTLRFLLANLSDFDYDKDKIEYKDLPNVDKYMNIRLKKIKNKIINNYFKYDFEEIYKNVNNFITNDLSSFYLDYTKDILYIDKIDSLKRRAIQTNFYDILTTLLKLLTPIIPHTASEVYSYIPNTKEKDIYLENFPITIETLNIDVEAEIIEKTWDEFLKFRDNVLKELEVARENKIIGKSLNAELDIFPNERLKEILSLLDYDLKKLLIVSKVNILDSKETTNIIVKKANGEICERCWIVSKELKDGICDNCKKIIS